jgi:hypothetical protein
LLSLESILSLSELKDDEPDSILEESDQEEELEEDIKCL